jgi:ubiquinone/menaquinone biosynthesis C-methylase UbiE
VPDSEDICERFWNLPSKPGEEARRERLFLDDVIQKAHLEREIASRLGGVRTILDAGAGTGRFSIPLARQGFRVTHLDISQGMIDTARQLAQDAGVLDRMRFERGRVGDLKQYEDGGFDLVICCDAPISYTYPDHIRTIAELARVAARALVISVSSRLGYMSYAFNPLQKQQYFADPASEAPDVRRYLAQSDLSSFVPDLDSVWRALTSGILGDRERIEREYIAGRAPWPHNYLFMPDELREILVKAGVHDLKLSGPGALARSIPNEVLRMLLLNDDYRARFLDLCYEFDSNPAVYGLGKDNLAASGLRPSNSRPP